MVTPCATEPTRLGRYHLVKVLDHGANGLVYEGLDPDQHRRVALKTISPSRLAEQDGQRLLERFRHEARVFGPFAHDNIVTLYEYDEEQGVPFIALELLQGQNLKECLATGNRFDVPQIVAMLSQILDAVAYMHARGVLHLDLKPANLILLADNQVKVTDFGIAQTESEPDTRHNTITGTPGYMSPEQLMGHRLDRRSDLFSVGVILYELLTGIKPFPGKQIPNIIQRVLNLSPEPPSRIDPQVPTAFDDVLQKALAKRPVDRYQTAALFLLAIQQAASTPLWAPPAHE
ncbi:MAG: serine/threonine protein kinase [Magnetococcales bacterium]|nr:serine/threonine protein kinase [Magnetococcales bacterium]